MIATTLSPCTTLNMLKKGKIAVLASLTILGGIMYSCNKQEDPSLPAIAQVKSGQNTIESMVSGMTADTTVQAYTITLIAYAKEYSTWYGQLAQAERAVRDHDVREAINNNSVISDPSHSAQALDAYRAVQDNRENYLEANYPQGTLSNDAYYEVLTQVYTNINGGLEPQRRGGGCVAGYYACHRLGPENACIAGYFACVQASPNSW